MTQIILFSTAIIIFQIIAHSEGQVYVNPNAPVPVNEIQQTAAPQLQQNNDVITQTVYGFLDFTTTIGNTVMIFSPQSASPPEPPKLSPSSKTVVNVIQTKPLSTATSIKPSEITPTKTATKQVKQLKISSVVEVVAGPPSSASISSTPKVEVVASKINVITNVKKSSSTSERKKNVKVVEQVVEQKPPMIVNPVTVKPSPPAVNKPIFSSIVEVHSSEDLEPVLQIGNNIGDPEYDFLSRQPSEFAEETYKVKNIKPTAKAQARSRAHGRNNPTHTHSKDTTHPTGLVTKLSGTVVKDGVTTVHETSVLGTYISGKYAQVLQSSSQVFKNNNKPRISPSSTLRILKTAAPTVPVNRHHIDSSHTTTSDPGPLPVENHNNAGPNLVRSSRRPATSSGSFKNRFRGRSGKEETDLDHRDHKESAPPPPPPPPPTSTSSTSSQSSKKSRNRSNKPKNRRYSRNSSTSVGLATVSVYSQLSSTPSYSSRRQKTSRSGGNFKSSSTITTAPPTEATTRRGFKPKVQPTNVESEQSTSLYKFKLNRAPGRWQYKTSPKPRVTIRKTGGEDLTATSPATSNAEVITNDIPSANARSDDGDLEQSGSINGQVLNDNGDNGIEKRYPVETINVEISTPSDFKETYYEIATIKTPYTFQVGSVKNTRYITVTSTFEKSLDPEPTVSPTPLTEPLTENILASTTHIDRESNLLDTSIATLPVLYLSTEGETPPLETLTETFSTTQTMLKTHILPIVREGGNSTSTTLVQTYHITRLVTATKTLPPMEAYQFVPSKRLKEFNSKLDEAGSELNLELEFGDETDDEDVQPMRQLPSDLDLANIGVDFDLPDSDKQRTDEGQTKPKKGVQKSKSSQSQQNLLPADQLQQLALLRLLNPAAAAQLPQVLTTSRPVIKLETVYESHVIPVTNGLSTSYSTISRPIATVSKTEFEIETSTLPPLPIPQVPVNPLLPLQPQPQFQITTAPLITQTMVTQTQSKILKLTFGAKTAFTTLYSTNVVPTVLTTFITTSVAVQPTAAAFPGFFPPPPYAPYPYVG